TRNFSANQKFNVWIQYDGTAKVLEVYQVMENLNEPTVPVISAGLDLASVFKTPDNEIIRDVYAGFTGHGADAFSTHAAIYKWSFKNDKYPIEYGLPEMTISELYLDASNISLSAQTLTSTGDYKSSAAAVVKDSLGNPVQGVPVAFITDTGTFDSTSGITATGAAAIGVTDVNGSLNAILTSAAPVTAKVRATAQGGAYAEALAYLMMTDEAKLNSDYNDLTADRLLTGNLSLDFVRGNLSLPLTGANGSTISWTSSNTSFLTSTGNVTRPTAAQGDQTVTLAAGLTYGAYNRTKEFTVKIKISDADMVALDSAWLTDAKILNGNASWDAVISNLSMPGTGPNGSTISWTLSDGVIAVNGTVTRPSYPAPAADAALTVTISMGAESITRNYTAKVPPYEPTDLDLITEAYNALVLSDILNANTDKDNIKIGLTLPATGMHGTTISWTSSNPGAIAGDGAVIRPAFKTENVNVTLTATLTKGEETRDKTFNLTVIKKDPTDSEAVEETLTWLIDTRVLNGNTSLDSVTGNLNLPASGLYNAAISWESTHAAAATNGTVTRPTYNEGDKSVTLTATISRGIASATKEFSITVKAKAASEEEILGIVDSWLTYGLIIGSNFNEHNVEEPLYLPISGPWGSTVSWSSTPQNIVSTSSGTMGQLTRPSYLEGDIEVTLTARADIPGIVRPLEKSFTVTVKALSLTDSDAVRLDSEWLNVNNTLGLNSTQYSIMGNLRFNLTAPNGSDITLKSDNPAVLDIQYLADGTVVGIVKRPDYSESHKPVIVTATFRKGSEQFVKTLEYTVLALLDTTSPNIVTISPADKSTDVPYNTKEVVITFDENIQGFNHSRGYGFKLEYFKILYNGAVSGADFAVNLYSNTLIIRNRAGYYPAGTNEIVIPADAITDMSGNRLQDDIRISFDVEERQIRKIGVISSTPANGENRVPLSTSLSVRFNGENLIKGSNFGKITIFDWDFMSYPIPVNCELVGNEIIITTKYDYRRLANGRMYSIDIPPGAVLDRFENSNTWEMITFYTVPEADYPEITNTWPKSGEGSVSVLPRIQLNFKGEAALSAGRISVSDENGNSVEFTLDAFADGSKTVNIIPINPLKPNTTYTVIVPSNFAKSRLNPGMPMKKDYAFTFTTGANSPAISSIYPADNAKNVPIDTKIEVEFSSEVKSGPRLSDVQVSDSAGNRILARALINGKKVSITLLNYWLNPDETYTFLVPAGAVPDLAGNSNDSLNFSFSTGKQINLAENASFNVSPS
ncbi:MAG: Ig-like domain-containing protein, partial [Eubacteriales bacterium]|nr:Ig-like domain-containing protein [Eubacteriales bacterium]